MQFNSKKMTGRFVISLDFELIWGVHDKRTIESYGTNIEKVHTIIPRLLELFEDYQIKATFSTVGLLFCKNKKEMLAYSPRLKPGYVNQKLSPYPIQMNLAKDTAIEDVYHYAPDLIALIRSYKGQEIGTHTFAHYYCLEPGQQPEEFEEDIMAAVQIAEKDKYSISSIVFPRNQCNSEYLRICASHNITSYRGNPEGWAYRVDGDDQSKRINTFRRAARLLDSYINISGNNAYHLNELNIGEGIELIQNIPASRFLRPYSNRLRFLEPLKRRRIKNSMTHAAKHGKLYHLWWHPHNFGSNMEENFQGLEDILKHFKSLSEAYDFKSGSMESLTRELSN